MNGNLEQDVIRTFEAPPWEQLSGHLEGRETFPFERTVGRVAAEDSLLGTRSTEGRARAKSGLTRRGIIYDYVRRHPGAHVRGMTKDLNLATGDLQYHLFWLEKHGFVKTKKAGFYRFVYPTMVFDERQEVLLGILSHETPREILLSLVWDSTLTQGDLAKSLGHSQPTISWHMDRLVSLGIVSKSRSSTGIAYEVTANLADILSFVKSYHPEVWRRWAGRLAGDFVMGAGTKDVDKGGVVQRAGLMPPAVVKVIGKR